MQKKPNKDDDLVYYVTNKLTLLQLMALLAVLGIVIAVILHYFFG